MAAWERFRSDNKGMSLPLVAAAIIPLVGFVGLATDAARGYVVKARLGDALDAAALAAAHELETPHFSNDIQVYFDQNFPPGYLGATVVLDPPNVTTVGGNQKIELTATATFGTTFMRIFNMDDLTVTASTEVTRATVSMDVVISMDMSGSMAGSRIDAATDAAKEMVNILFGGETEKDHLQIGIVPWNTKVNVTLNTGPGHSTSHMTTASVPSFTNPISGAAQSEVYYARNAPSVPLLSVPPSSWDGCVYARYPIGSSLNDDGDPDTDADHLLGPVTTVGGTDWLGWQHNTCTLGFWCFLWSPCLDEGITPLTNKKGPIISALNAMDNPTGGTNIAQGLAWAWRVVSPGEPFDDADPFPSGFHARAIVLLTDGEQQGDDGDAYDEVFGSGTSAGGGIGGGKLDDRLIAVADNIKAQGIKIYTIQYEHDSGPLADLMKEVATQPGPPYYHFAPDAATLQEVFQEIADDLSELRISK